MSYVRGGMCGGGGMSKPTISGGMVSVPAGKPVQSMRGGSK